MRLPLLFPLLLLAACGTASTTDTSGGSDTSGGGDTSGGDTGPNGYGDGACVSGEEWTGGNRESDNMNPGQACIECHDRGEGPSFVIAGTVYTNYDEPKNCNGLKGATVRITDANGDTFEAESNSVGNFFIESRDARIKTPYTAEVEFADGKIAVMGGDQTNGDCNACHTQDGTDGAPGRISNYAGE